ncbi:MAG: arsenate reductase (glutaredoxin) [Gammaproteobacteria bacterium]|nr:MAG: arsenate reductase (glutaredoxin) [Gammaproteobacteria bacterium]
MNVTIYHNPRCSKSRQTLALLQAQGIEPTVIEYLTSPPNPAQLDDILNKLGLEPRALMRTKEAAYAEAGLDDTTLDRQALIKAMVEHPILIERPIVVRGDKAALGRPPENVLAIL